jgi:starch phosphorylase
MSKASVAKKLKQYEVGGFRFAHAGDPDNYDRHLVFDHAVSPENASQRERFEAVSRTLRDLLTQRWLLTRETHDRENPKRVYYLSLEFLIGRTLVNNIINLGVEEFVRSDLHSDPRQDWKRARLKHSKQKAQSQKRKSAHTKNLHRRSTRSIRRAESPPTP